MAPTAEQLSFKQVLQIGGLRRLWFGQLVSIFGDFLALFAIIGYVSFRLHGTPEQVTGISIAYLIPLAFFGPLAGVFVDRWNVKTTMITSDLVRGVLALLLVFVHNLWGIYAIFFAISIVSSFFAPAQSVTIRAIVPKEGLMSANALIMQAMQVTRILSPSAASAIVAALGASACFYVDTASFFFSALMLSAIVINRQGAAPSAGGVGAVVNQLFSGMKFIFTHAAISFVVLAMGAGMFAMSCFGPLIAIYVRDLLRAGNGLYGVLSSLIGVGMLVGSLLLQRLTKGRRKEMIVLAGLLMIGLAIFVTAMIKLAAVTAIGMFGVGFGVAFIIAPAQALFQQETPVTMVGRVSSSVMSVLTCSQVLGLMISGTIAQAIGIQNLFFASAAMLAAVAGFGYLRIRARAQKKARA
jgi:DHA3 family macrolide efflux protein-like MFS transporter